MASVNKTAFYDNWPNLPPLVRRAAAIARENDFFHSCIPQHGELLQILARGRSGGNLAETGTGHGVGLAWIVEAVEKDTTIVSVEVDPVRAAASQSLFAEFPNVTVLQGDWRQIVDCGPFDLLVLDGGGGGKRENDPPAEPAELLKPGGTLVLDDFHPPLEYWPEDDAPRDQFGRSVTKARAYWLHHPDLFASEIRVHPEMSVVLGTRKAPQG